jgi:hypothetical protein
MAAENDDAISASRHGLMMRRHARVGGVEIPLSPSTRVSSDGGCVMQNGIRLSTARISNSRRTCDGQSIK